MSFRIDIGVILNNEVQEGKTEGLKEEEEEINKICKHLLALIHRLIPN
jgi:flagellar biosynthesis/type III secretory pathway protein FliH